MKVLRNLIIILVLFGVVFGYFGSIAYKKYYAAPRKKMTQQRNELQQQITGGRQQAESMRQFSAANEKLFSRSFPLNPASARTEYQLWLTQMAEFCEMTEPQVRIGSYQRGAGIASHQFQLRAVCTLEQLYRFLYEFYWTSYLHRINSMDIQPVAGADTVDISLVIEGLTMAKVNPNSPFPPQTGLPMTWSFEKRLSSGPFGAYTDYAKIDIFRYTQLGIDDAGFTLLTGLPTMVAADGTSVTQTRWRVESQGKNLTLGVGDKLKIGSFDGVVESIEDEMAILRQSNGILWAVLLGDKLSDAVAVPSEF